MVDENRGFNVEFVRSKGDNTFQAGTAKASE
jgi:hypothetical protein